MCRELHERFMPDRVWTRNKLKCRSITFIIHRVIHSTQASARPENHGASCFQGWIAAKNPTWRACLWKTMAFESAISGNVGRLIIGIEWQESMRRGDGFFARSSHYGRAAAHEVSAIHTRRSHFDAPGARERPCG
jgi:hypothetical protein